MAREIQRKYPTVKTLVGDCQQRQSLPDGHFDRILAIHVLEHLPNMPAALAEMSRLLSPTGIFCVVIPCDPGLAYGLARRISGERIFRRRYKQSYEWFIRREHINSTREIIEGVTHHFKVVSRRFFPLGVPLIDLNLCLGMVLRKRAVTGSSDP
jgi:ubiquinone/menaquinone biosynthesis C-methylase UbiE